MKYLKKYNELVEEYTTREYAIIKQLNDSYSKYGTFSYSEPKFNVGYFLYFLDKNGDVYYCDDTDRYWIKAGEYIIDNIKNGYAKSIIDTVKKTDFKFNVENEQRIIFRCTMTPAKSFQANTTLYYKSDINLGKWLEIYSYKDRYEAHLNYNKDIKLDYINYSFTLKDLLNNIITYNKIFSSPIEMIKYKLDKGILSKEDKDKAKKVLSKKQYDEINHLLMADDYDLFK